MNPISAGYDTRNGALDEAQCCLERGQFLHTLKEEIGYLFEGAEGAPDQEHVHTDACEDAVTPEAVRNQSWAPKPLLAADP